MALYFSIFAFQFKRFWTYPLDTLGKFGKRILDVAYIMVFWTVIVSSSRFDETNELNLNSLLGYLFIANGINEFTTVNIMYYAKYIMDDIKEGNLNIVLIRPVNVVIYMYTTAMGRNGIYLLIATLVIASGIFLRLPLEPIQLVLFAITLILGFIISIAVNLLVSVTAFFSPDARNFRNIVRLSMRILAGLIVPIYLFPEHVQKVLLMTPFPTMIYLPVTAISENYTDITPTLLLVNLAWAISLLAVALYSWKYFLRKYDAIGI